MAKGLNARTRGILMALQGFGALWVVGAPVFSFCQTHIVVL